jgi:hypothetical protein
MTGANKTKNEKENRQEDLNSYYEIQKLMVEERTLKDISASFMALLYRPEAGIRV